MIKEGFMFVKDTRGKKSIEVELREDKIVIPQFNRGIQ
jgi:hypothetical protein